MGIAQANGRNLTPFNLNKEVFIRFNSPSLHTLVKELIPKVARRFRKGSKEFFGSVVKRSGLKLEFGSPQCKHRELQSS